MGHCEFEPVPALLFRPGMKHACHLDVENLSAQQLHLRIWFPYFWPCVDKINPEVKAVLPQQHGSVPLLATSVQGSTRSAWLHWDTRAAALLQGWQLMPSVPLHQLTWGYPRVWHLTGLKLLRFLVIYECYSLIFSAVSWTWCSCWLGASTGCWVLICSHSSLTFSVGQWWLCSWLSVCQGFSD